MSGLIKVMRRGVKKPVPLFSRVDEAAQELPRTKGTGKEFMTELKKQPGVKKAELDDRKLAELESAPKMTKQEFINKIKEKPAAKIEETIKANPTDKDLDEMAMGLIEKEARERTNDELGKVGKHNREEWNDYYDGAVKYLKDYEYDSYLRDAKRYIEEEGGAQFPKFQDWKLPGGENYREILLRLPQQKDDGSALAEWQKRMLDKYGTQVSVLLTDAEKAEGIRLREAGEKKSASNYKSSHWEEPNVLAHMRVQDRKGPNGEKILHVEEIQSDWHQAGRKEGYRKEGQPERLKGEPFLMEDGTYGVKWEDGSVANFGWGKSYAERLAQEGKLTSTVPDAPFKKNWHELATKKLINYAIENGYDKVAFTPGAEQASRYNLAKQVEQITASQEDGKYRLFARDLQGKNHDMGAFDPNQLPDVVGKDLATKISAQQKPYDIYQGLDLQVGGEGMKGFYDKIIPNYLNNEYGKYGVSVGKIPIEVGKESNGGWAGTSMTPTYQPTYTDLHSIDITPQMREAIEVKGQPLYQAVGVGLTGAAAVPEEQPEFRRGGRVKLSDNPDTMMLELLSRRK